MRSIALTVIAEPAADPFTIAREAVELSRRLDVKVWLRISESYSFDVDAQYASESDVNSIANTIIHHRNTIV